MLLGEALRGTQPFPHLAHDGQRRSIPDPLTKIPKNTELRGFQATQKLGSRVIDELHAGEEQYDMGSSAKKAEGSRRSVRWAGGDSSATGARDSAKSEGVWSSIP